MRHALSSAPHVPGIRERSHLINCAHPTGCRGVHPPPALEAGVRSHPHAHSRRTSSKDQGHCEGVGAKGLWRRDAVPTAPLMLQMGGSHRGGSHPAQSLLSCRTSTKLGTVRRDRERPGVVYVVTGEWTASWARRVPPSRAVTRGISEMSHTGEWDCHIGGAPSLLLGE